MADNFRLNIGSLRSDVKLTLHTHHAARIWMGRPKNDLKAGIIGLSGFCTVVNRMSRGAQQDDPYSDWWMILLEEKINDSKEALKTIEDRLDTAMASLPPAISISENLSIQPVSLPLYISNPLGFQAVYLLTNYDEIVRRILLAQHVGLVGRHDMETWIDEGAAVLRRLFGLAQIYKYSGAARDDFAANNAKAEAARKMYERYGELPQDILEGTRRSNFAPPIIRGLKSMGQIPSNDGSLQQTAFRPLQQEAFQRLQQAASLKGLLKPFKGKGELTQFADLCRAQESDLKALAQEVLSQARRYPFTLVPVRLTEQNTQAGTQFLRWQQVTDRRMGVGVWAEMMGSPRTPESMLQDLYVMELQRITLNMQMSLLHSITKQAAECAEKMGQAEAVILMGTPVQGWEGNIGSAPEFKEFPNGNKDPRRLMRANVYFDNSIPDGKGGYEDRGGFWANVEWWHKDAEHYSQLFQKGMRVLVSGRAVMDRWKNDDGEFEALKIQASRVGMLPHRVTMVNLAPSQNQNSQQSNRPESRPQPAPGPDEYPDTDPPQF
eukprot:gene19733-23638_t